MGKHIILLGTHGDFIHTAEFDDEAKSLVETTKLPFSKDPSWLHRHPTIKDIVYSNGHVAGKVFCLKADAKGNLEILDEADSNGGGPTHLGVTGDGKGLAIAHYKSGNVSLIPLSPATGRFQATKPANSADYQLRYISHAHPRQESAHAHQIVIHGDEILVPDLGSNVIWRLAFENGGWVEKGVVDGLEEGDGPRHCVIHPSGNYIYVLNEVSNILTVHTLPPSGPSKLITRLPVYPPEDTNNLDVMTTAEIILIPPPASSTTKNSLLVCTNRDSRREEGDAMALYTVSPDGSTVKPTKKGWYLGVGNHIRALEVDPSGKYIVAAGRNGGGVVVLERDGEEDLKEVARCQIKNVVVPVWLS